MPDNTILSTPTKDTKVFLFVVVAALTVTAGCRYWVGTDYGNYTRLYSRYARTSFAALLDITEEPILPVIGKLSSILFNSYFPMFFAASVITVAVILKSMHEETTDFFFVTVMYVFSGAWAGSFNAVRQYIAITIVFLGRRYIYQRKFIKFLAVCFAGFLAHRSALFCVLIYFVYSEKITWKRLIVIAIATVFLARNYEMIFDFIGWMDESENEELTVYALTSVNIFRILVGCAPALLGIYFSATRKMDEKNIFYVYMMVAHAAIRIVTGDSAYLARLGSYTGSFVPLALNSITGLCHKRYRKTLRALIICLYFLYWLYEIKNSSSLNQFRWIFNYL